MAFTVITLYADSSSGKPQPPTKVPNKSRSKASDLCSRTDPGLGGSFPYSIFPDLPPPPAHCFLGLGGSACGDFRHVGFAGADAQILAHLGVHLGEQILVLLEEAACILAALADALAGVAVPGARLLHNIVRHGQVKHVALAADALAVKNVELRLAEG